MRRKSLFSKFKEGIKNITNKVVKEVEKVVSTIFNPTKEKRERKKRNKGLTTTPVKTTNNVKNTNNVKSAVKEKSIKVVTPTSERVIKENDLINKRSEIGEMLKSEKMPTTEIKKILSNKRIIKGNINSRQDLNNAIEREFYNTLDNIGLFKDDGAFKRTLKGDTTKIREFKERIRKAIEQSDKPFSLILNFSNNIDKAFELIYEQFEYGTLNSLQGYKAVDTYLEIIEREIMKGM